MTHFAHGGRSGPTLLTPAVLAELRRVGPFLCVGLVGFAVDATVFSGAYGAGLSRPVARAVSLGIAMVVTFGLNRSVTFAAVAGRDRSGEFLRYCTVTLAVQGFSYSLFLLFATTLPNLVALFVGAAAATVFSFAGQRLFTFRSAPPDRATSRAGMTALAAMQDRLRRRRDCSSQP